MGLRHKIIFIFSLGVMITIFITVQVASSTIYVYPTHLELHAWYGEIAQANVSITALNDTSVNITCEDPLIAPQNFTLKQGERVNVTIRLNSSAPLGFYVKTCHVNEVEVFFEITVEEKPQSGKLALSASSLTFTQGEEVREYNNMLYATNSYKWRAEVYQLSAPLWVKLENETLLPGETKPIKLRVDSRGLVPGAHYGGILRVGYKVVTGYGNFSFSKSLQVTLEVNATEPPPQNNASRFLLAVGVLDKEAVSPLAGATVIVSGNEGAFMSVTNETGYTTFVLERGTYTCRVLKRGYREWNDVVVMDRNRTLLVLMIRSNTTEIAVNNTNKQKNDEKVEEHKIGTLNIPIYEVNMTVPQGQHDGRSIPLVAKGGEVNISLQPVEQQPEWITASLSLTHLFEGQTAFLNVEVSPPNTTALGKYQKQFYIAYNGNVAVITVNVEVVGRTVKPSDDPSRIAIIAINGSKVDGSSVYRPVGLRVPLVSVLLRGNEAVTAEKPVQVAQNEIVYVIVSGDLNHVKVIPKRAVLLGTESRTDGYCQLKATPTL